MNRRRFSAGATDLHHRSTYRVPDTERAFDLLMFVKMKFITNSAAFLVAHRRDADFGRAMSRLTRPKVIRYTAHQQGVCSRSSRVT